MKRNLPVVAGKKEMCSMSYITSFLVVCFVIVLTISNTQAQTSTQFTLDKLCSEMVKDELVSPDGRVTAVLFERNCGATTNFLSHINLRSSSMKFKNTEFGTIDDGGVFACQGRPEILFKWVNSANLQIICKDCSSKDPFLVKESRWQDITITYITDSVVNPTREVFDVVVKNNLRTSIKVNRGDKIKISATGKIVLGLFAGASSPDGINGFREYNIVPNARHGSLLARVRQVGDDVWYVVGSEGSFIAESFGTLEFQVNDADAGNNSGQFNISVEITRKK